MITRLIPKDLIAITGSEPEVKKLSGGFSGDDVYLVNNKFVLKKYQEYKPGKIEIQKLAAKAGIAPKILHTNPQEKFILMEYAGKAPVQMDQNTIKHFADFLKALHKIEAPESLPIYDPISISDEYYLYLKEKNIPKQILDKLSDLPELRSCQRPSICHNDLNPNNLLLGRAKLIAIDWDWSGINDPYYDLGSICMWFKNIPDIKAKLLEQYLERKPTPAELKHLTNHQKVALAIAGSDFIKVAIEMGYNDTGEIINDSLSEFSYKIDMGEINLNEPKNIYDFGIVFLKDI